MKLPIPFEMDEPSHESPDDLEALRVKNAELRRRLIGSIKEANLLRIEAAAWRRWKAGLGTIIAVERARKDSDKFGCFRIFRPDEVDRDG